MQSNLAHTFPLGADYRLIIRVDLTNIQWYIKNARNSSAETPRTSASSKSNLVIIIFGEKVVMKKEFPRWERGNYVMQNWENHGLTFCICAKTRRLVAGGSSQLLTSYHHLRTLLPKDLPLRAVLRFQ